MLIKIGTSKICRCLPFVYIIYSREYHCVYIGQTLSHEGLIRRFADHLTNSSFRKHFIEMYGFEAFQLIKDLELFYSILPNNNKFESYESCFREAVEYNLQNFFRENKLNPYLTIISKVSNNNISAVGLREMKSHAERIFSDFKNAYNIL